MSLQTEIDLARKNQLIPALAAIYQSLGDFRLKGFDSLVDPATNTAIEQFADLIEEKIKSLNSHQLKAQNEEFTEATAKENLKINLEAEAHGFKPA